MCRSRTPSRIAQGQMVTRPDAGQLHRRVPDHRAGQALRGARRGDAGQFGPPAAAGRAARRLDGLPQVARGASAVHERTVPPGRRSAQPPQLLEGARGGHRRARPLPADPRRHVPQLVTDLAAQRPQRLRRRRVLVLEELMGEAAAPSGSEATKSGSRPRPKATSSDPPPMSNSASGPAASPSSAAPRGT